MANNIYVSPDGNDANPGTLASPVKTIREGVSRIQGAGDTVYIRGGTYTGTGNLPVTISKSGRSGAYITVKAYNNEDVILDGQHTLPYGPDNVTQKCYDSGQNADDWTSAGLVDVTGQYVWVEGLHVRRSRGRGMRVFRPDGSATQVKYVTVKNCEIEKSNNSGMVIEGIPGSVDQADALTQITVDGCTVWNSGYYIPRQHSSAPCNWPGAISVKAASYVTIKNTTVHSNFGEGILADSNKNGSKNITIQDCTFYDGMAGYISYHAVRDAVVERCVFYYTGKTSSGVDATDGVAIAPGEWHPNNVGQRAPEEYWGRRVMVRNNLFVGCNRGVSCIRGHDGSPGTPTMGDIWIYNNTFIRCNQGLWDNQTGRQPGAETYVKNNVFYNNTTDALASDAVAGSTIVADYNHWSSTPSQAWFQGANDVTGNPSLVNSSYAPTRGNFTASQLRLQSGSSAINQGVDLSTNPDSGGVFNGDYFGVTRSGTWDMGAHEYDGVTYPTPAAAFAASSTSPSVNATVTFTATISTGTAPYTVTWDFGDGNTATGSATGTGTVTATAQHAYNAKGTYTARQTVTDANSISDSDTTTIQVSPLPSGGGSAVSPVDIEQVFLQAGDASFTVSQSPSAILFVISNAIGDGTAADDAVIGIGVYDVTNGTGYCYGGFVDNGVSTTQTAEQMFTTSPLVLTAINGTAKAYATITSVSSTTVSLSWTGTTANERIIAWCFYGSGISNVKGTAPVLTTNGTGTTVTGDYNLAIMPASFRDDGNQGIVDFSLGFAERGGNQMCVGWHSRDNQSTSSTGNVVRTDRIAARPFFGDTIEVTSWTTSGITLTPRGRDLNAACPILLMKIDLTQSDIYIGVADTPTSTGNTDYALGFDPAAIMMVLSDVNVTDTIKSDSSSGMFGIAVVDDGGADRTIAIYDKDGAAPTVAGSYTDAQFSLLSYDGTVLDEGSASVSGNNLRLSIPSTVDSNPHKMLIFALKQGPTAAGGPTADFGHDADENTVYGDTVTFTDRSVSDGTYAITSRAWDFGDSNTATGATATHSYTAQGDYVATLTVTDANSATATATAELSIGIPRPVPALSVSPSSGDPPLTITFDASGSDAGGNETISEYWFAAYGTSQMDPASVTTDSSTATVVLRDVGTYDAFVEVTQANTGVTERAYVYDAVKVNFSPLVWFEPRSGGDDGVGPVSVNFRAHPNTNNTGLSHAWDFGDGNSTTVTTTSHTHTYATVTTTQTYTVALTSTWPDGSTATASKAPFIKIYPAQTAPPTVSAMYASAGADQSKLVHLRNMLGLLDNKTWVQESAPNTSVYAVEVSSVIWATGLTLALEEDDSALTTQANVAAVQANAGSAYLSLSGSTLTIYVHPTGSTNPNTNGSSYRWTAS